MAISNLEKYRKDLDALITEGAVVSISLYKQAYGARYRDIVLEGHGVMSKTH